MKNFSALSAHKLHEEIVGIIKSMIRNGDLKEGDKLPIERELAAKFQVSRATVREALSVLSSEGWVEIRRGSGTYVKRINPNDYIEPLAKLLANNKNQILQLFELRKMIEAEAAVLAAERATEEDLERIENAYLKHKEQADGRGMTQSQDFAFHYMIAKATHNEVLAKVMNTISDTFQHAVYINRALRWQEIMKGADNTAEEHAKIVDAIRRRDGEQARLLMIEHLSSAENKLLKHLGGVEHGRQG